VCRRRRERALDVGAVGERNIDRDSVESAIVELANDWRERGRVAAGIRVWVPPQLLASGPSCGLPPATTRSVAALAPGRQEVSVM
jgi:hypothetical protein